MWALITLVVGVSFSGVVAPGPFFAVTLAKSYRSPWAGTLMALGHAIIEIPLILLIYFGFSHLFQNNTVQVVLSLAGGAMISWMGVSMYLDRRKVVREGKDLPYPTLVAGIVMSAVNPFFLLWWATAGSLLVLKFMPYGIGGLCILIAAHWACDLIWLSFVSVFIYRTHHFLGRRFQEWLFTGTSLFLLVFGLRFIVSGIQVFFK